MIRKIRKIRTEPFWMAYIYHGRFRSIFFFCIFHLLHDSIQSFLPADPLKSAFSSISYPLHRIEKPVWTVSCLFECSTFDAEPPIGKWQRFISFHFYDLSILQMQIHETGSATEPTDCRSYCCLHIISSLTLFHNILFSTFFLQFPGSLYYEV